MGKGHEKTFLWKRQIDGQQIYEKMLNTNHQANANQNHNEIPPHNSPNGYYRKSTNNVLERMWRKGNPCALLVGLQTGAAPMGNSRKIL